MTRLVSIMVVYFSDSQFRAVRSALEEEFMTRVVIADYADSGGAFACVINVSVPDRFALHTAQRRLELKLPDAHIKMLERFRESWWRRYRWNIIIAIGGGIAVAFITDLLRSSAARLREMLG